jgi:hypothetical protein
VAKIILLANSYKHQGRCIAGIELDTNRWIRPVSANNSAIYNERFIDGISGNEPELLDILEIPVSDTGPDKGCQPENRLLTKGIWEKVGREKKNKSSN